MCSCYFISGPSKSPCPGDVSTLFPRNQLSNFSHAFSAWTHVNELKPFCQRIIFLSVALMQLASKKIQNEFKLRYNVDEAGPNEQFWVLLSGHVLCTLTPTPSRVRKSGSRGEISRRGVKSLNPSPSPFRLCSGLCITSPPVLMGNFRFCSPVPSPYHVR